MFSSSCAAISLPSRRNHPATNRAQSPVGEVLMVVPEILLDHERLDVYKLARELARVGNVVVQQVPPGRADLIDQFRRTSLSVPLNIAEGAGEFAPKEKAATACCPCPCP
jgi:hypothetical protein